MVAFMAVAAFAVQNSWRAEGDEWTIAGSESVLGSNWDVTDTNNNMTLGEDGITYTLVKENVTLGNGKYAYKVVKNHDWANENYGANGQLGGADCELVIAEDGVYNVTFTFVNDDSHALSAKAEKTGSAVVEKTYTVAGSPDTLFGTAWDPSNTANDMTLADGVYTWSKSDVELTAGNVEFKVVVNHSWDVSYGQNGESSNYVLKIEEAGIYTVTITFDAETNVPAAVATKTGDVVEPTYVYAVVGGKKVADGEEADAAIFSGNWDAAGTTDFMTLDEESGKYVWTKEAAKLDPQTIALKVIKKVEGAEDAAAWYPTDNVEIEIPEAGEYNVTVTFDPNAEDLWAQNTVVATAEPVVEPVVINSMAIVGDLTGGWPVKNEETGEWDWSMAQAMTQDAENSAVWTLTLEGVEVEAKKYEYKAAANNSWDGYQLPAEGNADFVFGTDEYPAGKYNLTFTANTEENTLTLAAEKVEEPVITDITISPAEGDIYAALAAAEEGIELIGKISINLTDGVTYTVSAPLVAYKEFEIQANGATIDASELNGNLIEMAATAEVPAEAVHIEYVSIHNATVKGLKKALFYSTQAKYLINWLTIDNSVIEVAADATTIDFTKKSAARNFNIENSTIYAPVATTKSFYSSQSGEKLTELDAEGIQTFIVKNSTMYNLAKGKNFFTHRQSNQKWLAYNVENSLFVNCGKSGQVIKGMNGGQSGANPTWSIEGNAFNFDGADTSAAEDTGDTTEGEGVQNSVAGVVTFTNAETGDFNGEFQLAEGATAPEALGDGRWTITFKTPVVAVDYYLVGDFNEWAINDDYKLTLNTEAVGVEEYMITDVELAEGAEFKVLSSTNVWYPEGENNNYVVGEAGKYTIYFRPNADGGEGWYYNVIYAENLTVGINLVKADDLKNAEIFNLNGQRVQNAQKGLYIVNGRKVVIK